MKIEVKVGKIEVSVKKQCNGHCRRMKPLAEFEINPRTGDLFATCNTCRAYLRAQRRIGKLVLDHDGITWQVDAYTNHPVYPYVLCRWNKGKRVAVWHADEATVKTCFERARKEPQRVQAD